MKALLDVNILIALLNKDHPDNAEAMNWFWKNFEQGWVSCPLTENGCIRILSQPPYPNNISILEAAERLRNITTIPYYQFIPDDVSLLDNVSVNISFLSGHRQLTDIYLLALAVKHRLRFVTFDARVRLDAVAGARHEHLVVI